jgi:hypothetical protein
MRRARLDDMIGGWFVGDFEPTLLATRDVEVAVKRYAAGSVEPLHHHRVATEITVLIEGEARMGDNVLRAGDIVVLDPLESSDFEACTDVVLVAVKHPGAPADKYLGRGDLV